jgi:beta-lactam-binding protein with PASTA domain
MKNPQRTVATRALAVALLLALWPLSIDAQTPAPETKLTPGFRMLLSTDPSLQEVARRLVPIKEPGPQRAEPAVGAFVRFQGDAIAFRAVLTAVGVSVHTIVANIATAEIPIRLLLEVAALPDVIAVEEPGMARPSTDVSVPATGANQIWYGAGGPVPVDSTTRGAMPPPWTGNTGQAVLVGIVDTGIDLTHEDFIDPSGNTRIVSVWDQTATKGTPPAAPSGYAPFTGNECTSDQINALRQKVDLIVTNPFASSTMTYMAGNGAGGFTTGSFTKGHNAVAVAVADFDRDGLMDIVTGNLDGTITFVKNNGGFSFAPQPPITVDANDEITAIATGDFNHDGLPDVVVVFNLNQAIAVLLGKGDGTFQDPNFVIVGNMPDAIAVADLNGDGAADLVVGNYGDGTISVLLGDGKGNFNEAKGSPFPASTEKLTPAQEWGTYPSGIVVGDFNGDGFPDLAVASFGLLPFGGDPGSDLSIIMGNGDGTFQTPVSYSTNYFSQAIAAGDFNRDGITDLAIQGYSQVLPVLLGNADGTFQTAKDYPPGGTDGFYSGQTTIVTADFNGDGILDLANLVRSNTPNGKYYDQLAVLLGNGDGTFGTATTTQTDPGGNSTAIALGNFHSSACTEVDLEGHGTNVAGIAAGNGSAGGHGPNQTPYRYMGMAPGAKLVVVKTTFQSQDIVDAVAYIENKATQLGLPVVINMSFGNNLGPHDGTVALDTMVSALAGPGQIIVASMGNDGADALHNDGFIENGGSTNIAFTVPAGITSRLVLDLWYAGQDQFGVTLTGPGGAQCVASPVYPGGAPATATTAACGTVTLSAFAIDAANGDQNAQAVLSGGASPIPDGGWTLTLLGSGCGSNPCVTSGDYDVWMPSVCVQGVGCASFNASDPADTLGSPASGANVIAVGSYATKTSWLSLAGPEADVNPTAVGDLSDSSSQGPQRKCSNAAACLPVQKPDVAAPGEEIMSSYAPGSSTSFCGYSNGGCLDPDGQHVLYQGTSQAAPHVTGGVALLLSHWGNMTPCQVKSSLSDARTDAFTGLAPNNSWGFGKLAVDQAINVPLVNVTVPKVTGLSLAAASTALVAANLSVGAVVYGGSNTVPVGDVISQIPSSGSWCGAVSLVISGIAVPQTMGDGPNSALQAITAVNLTVGTLTPVQTDTVPAGQIAYSIPGAGKYVAAGTTVNLFVSGVTVPAVTNQTKAAAVAAINGAGLFVGSVTRASSTTVPAGSIISQNPAAGQVVLLGSNVDLAVSAVPVPDITGQTLNVGEAVIVADNLAVGNVTQASSDTVPAGSIISVNPTPGTLVDAGTSIDIVVSGITVPDETGQPQATAESALTAAGLAIGNVTQAVSGVVQSGAVISENPGAGTVVGSGTAIDLVVSAGGAGQLTVPNVVGFTQANATRTLQNYGLTLGTLTTATSPTVPSGSVISESPAAGSPINPGASVNLGVSSGSGLQSINISPASPSMVPQMVLPLAAIGNYIGNVTTEITAQVTWGSSVKGVATVDSNGVVTAKAVGQTTVSAKLGSVNVSILLNVVPVGACDTSHDGTYSVSDVQSSLNQALGVSPPTGDLIGNGVVTVADVQITVNAVMGLGCASH